MVAYSSSFGHGRRLIAILRSAPPEPFPDTETGRRLYQQYRASTCVQLSWPHAVRYVYPGDVVSITYDETASAEAGPNPRDRLVEAEGYLLITTQRKDPGAVSDIGLHYLGWSMGGSLRDYTATAIRLHGERVDLPRTLV
jgi:hypothetical protein